MEIPPKTIASLSRLLRTTAAAFIDEMPESNPQQTQLKVDLSGQVDALLALWKAGAIDPQAALREFVDSHTPKPPTDPYDGKQTNPDASPGRTA